MSDLSNLLGNVYNGEADGRSVPREPAANLRNAAPAIDDDLAAALSAAIVEAAAPALPAAAPVPPAAPVREFSMPAQPMAGVAMPQPAVSVAGPAPAPAPAPTAAWTAPAPMIAAPIPLQNWALGDDDIVPGVAVAAKRGKRR